MYDGDSRPEIGVQNATIEAARARVRELEAAGVDFVKIYEMVSPDIFEALVDEARSLDLPIAAHVPLSMVASRAGPAVDSMEHLRNIEMDCATNSPTLYEERLTALAAEDVESGFALRSALHRAQRLPAIANYDEARCERTIASLRATTQVPTLGLLTLSSYSPFARPDWPAVMAQVPEAARDAWQAATDAFAERSPDDVPDTTYAEWGLDMVGKMHAAGVPIGAGTDTPIGWALPGDSLHVELERLVEAGLSTLDALTSATLRPAEFNRVSHEIGVVNVGYYADLVVLSENPLTDIRKRARGRHRDRRRARVANRRAALDRVTSPRRCVDEQIDPGAYARRDEPAVEIQRGVGNAIGSFVGKQLDEALLGEQRRRQIARQLSNA